MKPAQLLIGGLLGGRINIAGRKTYLRTFMSVVYKLIVAIVAIIVTAVYIQPLLVTVLPPLGLILVVLIFIGIVAWLLLP